MLTHWVRFSQLINDVSLTIIGSQELKGPSASATKKIPPRDIEHSSSEGAVFIVIHILKILNVNILT